MTTEITRRPVDFEVTIGWLGGSLRITIPSLLVKEVGLKRGDSAVLSLVQVGSNENSKAILVMKKSKGRSVQDQDTENPTEKDDTSL